MPTTDNYGNIWVSDSSMAGGGYWQGVNSNGNPRAGQYFYNNQWHTGDGAVVNDSGGGGGTLDALLAAALANSGGGSGGGYHAPDHFNDLSPMDQFNINRYNTLDAANAANQAAQNALDLAKFNHQQAQDAAQLALAQGDLALAQQKQKDANYWQGVSAQIDQQRIAASQQSAAMQYQASMAGVAQQREDSNARYAVGMANAANDAQRIQVEARWNQEQAAIAKMEDYTRMVLGTQANQTGQFSAETDRAARMGQLGLDVNKFLLEKASSPSDLFGLYFLQRGVTPDWTALSNGNVMQGDPMKPVNPMSVFTPTTAAPVFGSGTPVNPLAAAVGQATGGGAPAASAPAPAPAAAPAPGAALIPNSPPAALPPRLGDFGGGGVAPNATGLPLGNTAPAPMVGDAISRGTGEITSLPWQATPAEPGSFISADRGLLRLGTGGATMQHAFVAGDPPPGSRRPNEELVLTSGPSMVVPLDKMPSRMRAMMDFVPHHAMGGGAGYTASGAGIVGSGLGLGSGAMSGSPIYLGTAGGSPQGIPTGPGSVTVTNGGGVQGWNTLPFPYADFGLGGKGGNWGGQQQISIPSAPATTDRGVAIPYRDDHILNGVPASSGAQYAAPAAAPASEIAPKPTPSSVGGPLPPTPAPAPAATGTPATTPTGTPVRNVGQDVSGAYTGAGMGSTYIQSSNNPGITNPDILPPLLRMLYDFGVPLPPTVVSSLTGGAASPLDIGNAFRARGLGMAPSLQTLNSQTRDETDLLKGAIQGVGGISFTDFVDALSRPTKNLQAAQRSRVA